MSFHLVPKSVTLNDFERRNGPYFALLAHWYIVVSSVDRWRNCVTWNLSWNITCTVTIIV